jgi:hypothetical protein
MATWRGTFGWKLADGTGDEVEAEVEDDTIGAALDSEDLIDPDVDLDGEDVVALTVHLARVE